VSASIQQGMKLTIRLYHNPAPLCGIEDLVSILRDGAGRSGLDHGKHSIDIQVARTNIEIVYPLRT
jgi:hypothetical protein